MISRVSYLIFRKVNTAHKIHIGYSEATQHVSPVRKHLFAKASLAEVADRYDEMFESIKKLASMDVELTVEERDLLRDAFKNLIQVRSTNLPSSSLLKQQMQIIHKTFASEDYFKLVRIELRNQMEKEFTNRIFAFLEILDNHLIPSATTGDSKILYYRMKGDCYKYLTEFYTGKDLKEAVKMLKSSCDD